MHFRLEQPINVPRGNVEEAITDPRFYVALGRSPNLAVREVLDRRQVLDTVVLEVRFAFTGDLSPTVRTFVDAEKLTWVTTTTVYPDEHRAEFLVMPDHYAGWLKAEGRYEFEVPGDDGSRTLQLMEGEISVRIPVLGRAAEKGLVTGFARHLEEQASLLESWEAPPE